MEKSQNFKEMKPMKNLLKTWLCVWCRLLNESKGSLLDDEQLVNTLQSSKATSQEVSEQLITSETTEAKIDAAREVSHHQPVTNTNPSLAASMLGLRHPIQVIKPVYGAIKSFTQ
jgi:hypothetical protein